MTRTVIVSIEAAATADGDESIGPAIAEAIEKWAQMPDVRSGCQPPSALITHTSEEGVFVKINASWRTA